jgi:DNA-directed RNA polymerase subunit RPC12/RpoP
MEEINMESYIEIAISESDYNRYGCPYCGCKVIKEEGLGSIDSDEATCIECHKKFFILSNGTKTANLSISCPDDIKPSDNYTIHHNSYGIWYTPKLQEHPMKDNNNQKDKDNYKEIAISESDWHRYGCPYCGSKKYEYGTCGYNGPNNHSTIIYCLNCGIPYITLADGLQIAGDHIFCKDDIEPSNNYIIGKDKDNHTFYTPKLQEHPRKTPQEGVLVCVKRKDTSNEYVNELTKLMDAMTEINEHPDFCVTYITNRHSGVKSIRFPGASRGYIEYNEDCMVTKIELYEDTCFDKKKCTDIRYKREVVEAIQKYIGWQLVYNDDLLDDEPNPTGQPW